MSARADTGAGSVAGGVHTPALPASMQPCLSTAELQKACRSLTDAVDALDSVQSQIGAMCAGVLALLPDDSLAGQLPRELQNRLDAARVLLSQSLPYQADQLECWVGVELESLGKILNGGAA